MRQRVQGGRVPARAVLSAIALLACLAMPEPARAFDAVGEIVLKRGEVAARRAAGMVALGEGAPIFHNDRIRTGPGSRARIAFTDGSLLRLGAYADVTVAAYLARHAGAVGLLDGILRVSQPVGAAEARFEIRLPAATVSLRAADLLIETGTGATSIYVLRGEIAVATGGGTAVLGEGYGIDLGSRAAPEPPRQWSERRIADMLRRTRLGPEARHPLPGG